MRRQKRKICLLQWQACNGPSNEGIASCFESVGDGDVSIMSKRERDSSYLNSLSDEEGFPMPARSWMQDDGGPKVLEEEQ